MTKKPKVGDQVQWKWGAGKGEGEVTDVHTEDVERTIEGSKIKRAASKAKPAIEAKTSTGAKVLKSVSEVKVK